MSERYRFFADRARNVVVLRISRSGPDGLLADSRLELRAGDAIWGLDYERLADAGHGSVCLGPDGTAILLPPAGLG